MPYEGEIWRIYFLQIRNQLHIYTIMCNYTHVLLQQAHHTQLEGGGRGTEARDGQTSGLFFIFYLVYFFNFLSFFITGTQYECEIAK